MRAFLFFGQKNSSPDILNSGIYNGEREVSTVLAPFLEKYATILVFLSKIFNSISRIPDVGHI